MNEGNHSYNPQIGIHDSSIQAVSEAIPPDPDSFLVRPKTGKFQRKRCLTERAQALRKALLSQRVGYIKIEPFAHRAVFDSMPKRSFAPGEVVPCKYNLCVIERGWIQIRHRRYKYCVKTVGIGAVFGEMPSLGQTMLTTEAVAGANGVTVTVLYSEAIDKWITAEPASVIQAIVPNMAAMATDRFRAQYQPAECRVAALLLSISDGDVISGYSQEQIAVQLGLFRETVSSVLTKLRALNAISTARRKIVILDEEKLKELSEM